MKPCTCGAETEGERRERFRLAIERVRSEIRARSQSREPADRGG